MAITTLAWPRLVARSSGVSPSTSATSVSAPQARRSLAIFSCPPYAAMERADQPHLSRTLTLAPRERILATRSREPSEAASISFVPFWKRRKRSMEGIDFLRRREAGECDAEVSERIGGGRSGNGGSSWDSNASISCGKVRVRITLGLLNDPSISLGGPLSTSVVCAESILEDSAEMDASFTTVAAEDM